MKVFKNLQDLADNNIYYSEEDTFYSEEYVPAELIYLVERVNKEDADYTIKHFNGKKEHFHFISEAGKKAFLANRGSFKTDDPNAATSPDCLRIVGQEKRLINLGDTDG